jgi:hypothetical protein
MLPKGNQMKVLRKIAGLFTGKTINAHTGKVEQPVSRVQRPHGAGLAAFAGLFCIICAAALLFSAFTGLALADGDDITTMITTLTGYWTAIKVIGIAVLLWVLGKRLLRKGT